MSSPGTFEMLARAATDLVTHGDVADGLDAYLHVVALALDASTVGLLVRGRFAEPELFSATSHRTEELELFQVSHGDGPCLECLSTGQVVIEAGTGVSRRWPIFGPAMHAAGLQGVTAIPLRWHENIVGALNIFRTEPIALDPQQLTAGHSAAAVATLALSSVGTADRLTRNIISSLSSRVVIEQAKGFLSDRLGIDLPTAYAELCSRAQTTGRSLPSAAREVFEEDRHNA
ncbi:MAG: GAF and ANTAR domain-containing protein [Lapillicoccus sp.]